MTIFLLRVSRRSQMPQVLWQSGPTLWADSLIPLAIKRTAFSPSQSPSKLNRPSQSQLNNNSKTTMTPPTWLMLSVWKKLRCSTNKPIMLSKQLIRMLWLSSKLLWSHQGVSTLFWTLSTSSLMILESQTGKLLSQRCFMILKIWLRDWRLSTLASSQPGKCRFVWWPWVTRKFNQNT